MTRLSITWRTRLAAGSITALLLLALVILAQVQIRRVLYASVDSALKASAANFREMRGPMRRGPGGRGPEPSAEDLLRWMTEERRGGPDGPGGRGRPGGPERREPPVLHFGSASLLPPRRLNRNTAVTLDGKPAWSAPGYQAALTDGEDLRDAPNPDDVGSLRVYSVRLGDVVVQTAATLSETEAALDEIRRALLALLLPLGLVGGIAGALLTEVSLAPLRQLTRAASRLDPSNLTGRLPAPGGGDTFDQLVHVLNAMLGRLEAAFARQKRFTADASHELRTPLAVVKASASFLLEDPDALTPKQRRNLQRIDRTADRANALVADLLQLARSEHGALTARRSPTHVAALLDEAVDEARTAAKGPSAPVEIRCDAALEAHLDPDLIHRLVVNLTANALRHTPEDGQVTVSAARTGDRLTVRVTDTGEGVPPEALERLGEPFFRPDEARAREGGGAGLGLALCRAIARAHGGTLTLASAPGEGLRAEADLAANASAA